jgi:predicted O-linked N-acetylglucosamine transferase (SPINDLY family)
MLFELDRLSRKGAMLDTFTLLGAFDDPERHLAAARVKAGAPFAATPNARPTGARLRVAYLSPNFHFHPVAHQAVALFEAHDRGRFETFGICVAPGAETPIRQRLRAAFDHFIEAGHKSDIELARLLSELQIDIAVDLAGYTSGGRTAALRHRPAPIAVNWLGYPGTTGASYVDYIIADPVLIPPGDESLFTEKIVRLPGTYMPRDTKEACNPAPPRSQLGLPEDGFVFCGFNNTFKITPEIFDIWMRLLGAIDGSVLWLNIQDSQARANLCREAAARAIAPQRLVFAERAAERRDHLSRLAAADLFLDTMPYGAHSTANDMLWRGVPVLTCSGRSFASRVAASMLAVAELEELIAPDLGAYEGLALSLAREPGRLTALRNKLAQTRQALFDGGRFCRALESAYETMAERHNRGQKPQSFSVIIPT